MQTTFILAILLIITSGLVIAMAIKIHLNEEKSRLWRKEELAKIASDRIEEKQKYRQLEDNYNERRISLNESIASLIANRDKLIADYKQDFESRALHFNERLVAYKAEVERQEKIIQQLISNQPKQIVGVPVPGLDIRR